MSWFQKNYEKAALGGAAVIALGLAYAGWAKFGGISEEFATTPKGAGNNNSAVKDADLVQKATSSFKLDRTWNQALVGDRPVDLFTGIPLYIKSSSPEDQVDLIKDEPVHPPIPNTWWIENRLDPGFADSPDRDPDGDGFSNLEEYNSKTDPNDPKSVPALIAKLMYVKDESLTWVLRPGYGEGGNFPFTYEDTKGGVNKTGAADMIAPGGMFFAKGSVATNRFKLLGSEVRKELNKKVNIEMEVTIVRVEDQRPNKKGTIYEIPSPLSDLRKNEHLKFDRTAVLSLEALGQEGKEFKVEENTAFALPPGAATKDYMVKTVTAESITVEYPTPSGEKKTVQIPKGAKPTITE